MRYIVRNLYTDGPGVGTLPLSLLAAVNTAAMRTGQPAAELGRTIRQLDPQLVPSVTIPALVSGAAPVKVEVV